MEIQKNEYIRTDNGQIFKVLEVEKGSVKIKSDYREWIGICCIQKHSFNIIDLIEVGDVIQLKGEERLKYEVLKISWSDTKGKHIHIINPFRTEGGKDIFIEDIEGIVTKEQFKSIKYEV